MGLNASGRRYLSAESLATEVVVELNAARAQRRPSRNTVTPTSRRYTTSHD
jgi:hypothetical protein